MIGVCYQKKISYKIHTTLNEYNKNIAALEMRIELLKKNKENKRERY